jgi:hypothetical protein
MAALIGKKKCKKFKKEFWHIEVTEHLCQCMGCGEILPIESIIQEEEVCSIPGSSGNLSPPERGDRPYF